MQIKQDIQDLSRIFLPNTKTYLAVTVESFKDCLRIGANGTTTISEIIQNTTVFWFRERVFTSLTCKYIANRMKDE